MTGVDEGWAQRHIRSMRCVRHWCFVEGCVGSAPLMWVPTELEVWAERQPRGRAIDFVVRWPRRVAVDLPFPKFWES